MSALCVESWSPPGHECTPTRDALFVGEAVEHAVVEIDERAEQPTRRVELERQPRLGEVDLDDRATSRQPRISDGRLAHEVVDERLARVAGDPVGRVHEADRGGGDDGLLERASRVRRARHRGTTEAYVA